MEDRDGDVAKAILDYETTIKSLQSKAKKLQDKVDKPIDRTDAEDVKAHNDAKVELGNINEQIQLYSQALNYLQEMLPSEVNNVQETETNDEVETPTNEVEGQLTENTQETTKRTFEYFKGSLKDLIALGKNATEKLNKMLFSNVSERLEKDLKGKGLNVTTKFKHAIDDQHIKHTLNNHAIGKEEDRGQIEIQEKDFEQLKDVYDNYNEISASKTNVEMTL